MTENVIHFALLFMGIRTTPNRRSNFWVGIAVILYIMVFVSFEALQHFFPALGWPFTYLLLAIMPFLFGLKWSTRTLSESDRQKLRQKTNPRIFVCVGLIFATIEGILGVIVRQISTWRDFGICLLFGVAIVLGIMLFVFYLPFTLGRTITSRRARIDD